MFRSYSSTRLFTLRTSFNEKNEQDDKQAHRSVHLESQSSLTIVSIVLAHTKLSILQQILEVAQVLQQNDITHDLHLDGLGRLVRSLEPS